LEAKRAFLNAYRARPHYAVLYNVAQAEIRLGNVASAIEFLERFLNEGADELSDERRTEATQRIAELRARASEGMEPNAGAVVPGSVPQGGTGALNEDRPLQTEAGAQPAMANPMFEPALRTGEPPGTNRLSPTPQLAPSALYGRAEVPAAAPASRPWGFILTGSGVALLGTALGLYVWNGGRHERWQTERTELDAVPDLDRALETDAGLWARAKANNDLLASVQRVDIAALLAAGVGALALGAGAWEFAVRPAASPTALAAAGASVNWRTQW
jgi:hypothetical protein